MVFIKKIFVQISKLNLAKHLQSSRCLGDHDGVHVFHHLFQDCMRSLGHSSLDRLTLWFRIVFQFIQSNSNHILGKLGFQSFDVRVPNLDQIIHQVPGKDAVVLLPEHLSLKHQHFKCMCKGWRNTVGGAISFEMSMVVLPCLSWSSKKLSHACNYIQKK